MVRLVRSESGLGDLLGAERYKELCSLAEQAFVDGAGETVALVWRGWLNGRVSGGCRVGGSTEGYSILENAAPWPEVRFTVNGAELKQEIARLHRMYGDSLIVTCLWHSHQRSREASKVDVREFPAWLTSLGAIYVASGGETVFYNGHGMLSKEAASEEDSTVIIDYALSELQVQESQR